MSRSAGGGPGRAGRVEPEWAGVPGPPGGSKAAVIDRRRREFETFFDRHYRELGRLACLLTGDPTTGEDLTSEVFLAVWRQWERVWAVDEPLAYVRRMMANLAASRVRRITTERRSLLLMRSRDVAAQPDGGDIVDVRTALQKLPRGQRECVVLRHAFDLTEADAAAVLGVSLGTVKSQTSKGMRQLELLLGPTATDRWDA